MSNKGISNPWREQQYQRMFNQYHNIIKPKIVNNGDMFSTNSVYSIYVMLTTT
jgi:hypothetical protein